MNNEPYNGNIKIFSCNSNLELSRAIAKNVGVELGSSEVSKFSDGEISMRIDETVRESDVFIVQSTCPPVNDNLMELLIMIDAMKRASAGRITAVIPYYGYARQDRKSRSRDPISAKLVANLLTTAGANRVLTMDLHCTQIQGFFDIPVDNLVGMPLLYKYYKDRFKDKSDLIIVSPDLGSVTRSRSLAEKMDVPMAIVDKRRQKANVSEVMNIIGSVEGKKVLMIDDMIDTAGSITNAANALTKAGATEVYAACTHGVLSGPALERIESSTIKELIMLDTVPLPDNKKCDKIKMLTVAEIFAEGIKNIHYGKSVSKLFE